MTDILADLDVMHEGIDGFTCRVKVGHPIPPDVEAEARLAQLAPAVLAEMLQRINAAGGYIGVVIQVVIRIEQPDCDEQVDVCLQLRGLGV